MAAECPCHTGRAACTVSANQLPQRPLRLVRPAQIRKQRCVLCQPTNFPNDRCDPIAPVDQTALAGVSANQLPFIGWCQPTNFPTTAATQIPAAERVADALVSANQLPNDRCDEYHAGIRRGARSVSANQLPNDRCDEDGCGVLGVQRRVSANQLPQRPLRPARVGGSCPRPTRWCQPTNFPTTAATSSVYERVAGRIVVSANQLPNDRCDALRISTNSLRFACQPTNFPTTAATAGLPSGRESSSLDAPLRAVSRLASNIGTARPQHGQVIDSYAKDRSRVTKQV
jgi:hypothetical protein